MRMIRRYAALLASLALVACGEELPTPVDEPPVLVPDPGPGPAPDPDPVPQPLPPPPDPLASWRAGGTAGKRLVVWGNSTVSHAVYFFDQLSQHTVAGGRLEGLSPNDILNYGNNGASLAALLSGAGPFPIDAVIAAQPDLLIMRGPLINDVRLGGTGPVRARALLQEALDRLRSGSPRTAILLTTENSLLATDPGGFAWVSPTGAAQEYTDTMRTAVMSFRDVYPDVLVYDLMASLYGTVAPSTSPWMANQLHPNEAGQRAEADLIATLIGSQAP